MALAVGLTLRTEGGKHLALCISLNTNDKLTQQGDESGFLVGTTTQKSLSCMFSAIETQIS